MTEQIQNSAPQSLNTFSQVLDMHDGMPQEWVDAVRRKAAEFGEPGFEMAAVIDALQSAHDWEKIAEDVPITASHTQQHAELSASINPAAALPPRKQRFIGEVMELGDAATKNVEADGLDTDGTVDREGEQSARKEALDAMTTRLEEARKAYGLEKARSGDDVWGDLPAAGSRLCKAFREVTLGLRKSLEGVGPKEVELAGISSVLGALKDIIALDEQKRISATNYYQPSSEGLFSFTLPKDILKAAYFSNKDSEGGNVRYLLNHQLRTGNDFEKKSAIYTMADLYGVDCQELIEMSRSSSDTRLQAIAKMPETMAKIALEAIPSRPKQGETLQDYTFETFNRGIEILKLAGFPDRIMFGYQRAIEEKSLRKNKNGRTEQDDEFGINIANYKLYLDGVLKQVTELGVEKLTRLYDEAGIINFDNYSSEQLDRMDRYLSGDAEFLKYLYDGDITVVFTDANGDHNGAFRGTADTFDVESGRALFFEIQQPGDVYRHMIQLRQQALKPSTLVLGAHGSPGTMHFGSSDKGKDFRITNYDPEVVALARKIEGAPDIRTVAEADGFKRLVDEYMTDIHDADAAESAKGRRRIILKSCSQAVQASIQRRINGKPQEVSESTAETMVKTANNPKLDVHAVAQPANISRGEDGNLSYYTRSGTQAEALKHSSKIPGTVNIEKQPEIAMRAA